MINIEQCYSTGTIQGTSNVGGLVGSLYNARVTNSFSTCKLEETLGWRSNLWERQDMFRYFGGFTGTSGGVEIINCYSAGEVAGAPYDNYPQVEYKGFLGSPDPSYYFNDVTSSYFDFNKSGRNDNYGTSKTTAEMKQQSTFNLWDFTDIWGIESSFNEGYPFLLFSYTPPPAGGVNIFVITDKGLKQVLEVHVVTDEGLKIVSVNNII